MTARTTPTPPTGRIVLLGATGFTGRLAAHALFRLGRRPTLAARSPQKLGALAAELSGLHGGTVSTEVTDVADAATLVRLVGPGDVLVTTVGPFGRLGHAAAAAAASAGAAYVDSTGEPAFIREVFERYAAPARDSGAVLLPAFGCDYVPGNLAAGLAIASARTAVTKVDVGYFLDGLQARGASGAVSSGTAASLLHAMGEPGYSYRGGRLVTEVMGRRRATFGVGGARRSGVAIGSSEHLSLPRLFPALQEVGVYLGWFGPATRLVQGLAHALPAPGSTSRLAAIQAKGRTAMVARLEARSGRGPSAEDMAKSGTRVVAVAYDRAGRAVGRGELAGVNGYLFTGEMLAWAAARAADGKVAGPGVLGPLEAFGVADLLDGVRAAGLRQVG